MTLQSFFSGKLDPLAPAPDVRAHNGRKLIFALPGLALVLVVMTASTGIGLSQVCQYSWYTCPDCSQGACLHTKFSIYLQSVCNGVIYEPAGDLCSVPYV